MVVLLIGGGSVLMNSMIDKMNKNGHRVYLLTGKREHRFNYKHVFEKYNFPYESGSVKDIMESVRPEVVIFMGAYDTNYNWEEAREESVRYTAGLTNILSAYSIVKSGLFVYFSSQEVYGTSHIGDISEEQPITPKGFRAMAVAQGEEICANYRRTQGMNNVILRFDHLYWVPERGKTEDNPCFRMCLEALKTGTISVNDRRTYSMIYLNDAVELAYKIINGDPAAPTYDLYHISSGEEIGEMELAGLIREEMGKDISIVDNTVGMSNRLVLSGNRYKAEYPQKIFTTCEKGIRQVARFMRNNSSSFLTEEDIGGGLAVKTWGHVRRLIKALFPFLESIIGFLLVFLVNGRAAESEYFARLDLYLLYVLLFAVVHGQQQAIFSALLAVIGYCIGQAHERTGFDVLLDYNTYVWMAQLFIVGLVVGYMKDQLHFIAGENRSRVQYLNGQLRDIEDINESNVRMKHNFETQIVNQKESLGKIYEITSSLSQYGREEVLFYAAEMLAKLMDTEDVALYTVANGDYARLFSATSKEARRLGYSIRYTAMETMYGELKERRVYINRDMEDKMPMMASAVYSEDDMQLILMVWGIPWERMTLGEANRLTIVGDLIQNEVVRASRYLEALHNQRYVEGTNILDEEAFTLLERAFAGARDKGLTEYVLLEIVAARAEFEQAAEALGKTIRQSDYMGLLGGGRLCVLLSNTNRDSVGGIVERFQNLGYECRVEEEIL